MKRLLVLAVLVVGTAFGAATAHADGDPASDILVFQDVFFPYPKPSPELGAALNTAVAGVNAHGMKLKVAVLAEQSDMGTARSLFGRPADYAKFLGTELSYNYNGLLLVVMPAGFGLFKDGSDTARYEHAVSSVNLQVSNVDDLTRTATSAVHRLGALGADVDRVAPRVLAFSARAKRGAKVDLVYDVTDDSGRSREVVRVYAGPRVVATLRSPIEVTHSGILDAVHWRVPRGPAKAYRFCVVATDPAGNTSRPSCAPIRVS